MLTAIAMPVSQKDQILSYLNQFDSIGRRRGLSQMEALGLYRITRLASRIDELRKEGHAIQSEMRTDPTGKRYCRYFLEVKVRR